MPISTGDIRVTPFRVGSFRGVGGPTLQTSAGTAFNGQKNEHFIVNNGIVKYALTGDPMFPGAQQINFAPAGTHNNMAYLPYRDNNITSIRFGNNVNRFVTDNLSGCSVFVDQMPNGDIVVYHANVQGGAYRPTHEQSLNARYEREVSIAVKRQFHTNAKRHYAGAVELGSLFKNQYNTNAARSVNLHRFAGQELLAVGTTVLGFRTGNGWQFWYQTWTIDENRACRVTDCEQFV